MWMLELRLAKSLEDQLAQLMTLVAVDVAVWRSVVDGFDVDVYCGVYLQSDNEGIEIAPEMLAWLAERSLSVGFDIYFDPDDEG
jgi:hypothetical protein